MNTKRMDPKTRFLYYVRIDEGGCWRWQGELNKRGYGQFLLDGRSVPAYRAGYTLFVGAPPARQHLHHECPNKDCVNPAHLSLLSASEHTKIDAHKRAANSANRNKTNCPRGHEYSEENTGIDKHGSRYCKQCSHERGFERRIRLGETPGRGVGWHEKAKTHCPQGHEYTLENTYLHPKGSRICKTCKRDRDRRTRSKE